MQIPEFAENLSVIREYLTRRDKDEWITHLIKIQIFDVNKGLINHWKQEIYALFHDIAKMKRGKKYPSKDFIFNTIWDHYGDRLDTYVEKAEDDIFNEKLKYNINYNQVYQNIKDYIIWLADKLSREGRVKPDDVYNKLWELGF